MRAAFAKVEVERYLAQQIVEAAQQSLNFPDGGLVATAGVVMVAAGSVTVRLGRQDVTMEATVRGRSCPAPHHSTLFTPAIHQAIRQNYTAMVENIDRQAGVFLDEVRRRRALGDPGPFLLRLHQQCCWLGGPL